MSETEILIATVAIVVKHERSVQEKWRSTVYWEGGHDVALTWRPPNTGPWNTTGFISTRLKCEAVHQRDYKPQMRG